MRTSMAGQKASKAAHIFVSKDLKHLAFFVVAPTVGVFFNKLGAAAMASGTVAAPRFCQTRWVWQKSAMRAYHCQKTSQAAMASFDQNSLQKSAMRAYHCQKTSQAAMASSDQNSLLTLTENKSATFSSSSDPCVDFFFQIVPDTPSSKITSLLSDAWLQDRLTTLKLIFHLRAIRGTGKADKDGFYTCTSWLHQQHPNSLLANLPLVPKFGYYKDLLEMVLREIEGFEGTEKKLEEKQALAWKRRLSGSSREGYWARKGAAAREAKKNGVLLDKETRIAASLELDKAKKEEASKLRKQKRLDMASVLQIKLKENPNLTALHEAVANIFAEQLVADKRALESKDYFNISFAAKWCPSVRKSYDLRTGLYNAIASRLYGQDECLHLDEEKRAIAVGDKMRKEYLVPLRQALEMPEIYMCANKWAILPYERVPSVAMKNYVDHFLKHDNDRYMKFLENVVAGKKKVAAGALLPHKVAQEALKGKAKPQGTLAEAQWKRMVCDLKEIGSKLGSSMAVCDVSGSMSGTPMEVCIALGLLVAELSDEPWKNHLCTFSRSPEIHVVEGDTLAERYWFTRRMAWGMNTDFQKVFRTLLDVAIASELPKEKMIRRLFVFSDMEFDAASANPWETDYVMITKMYEEAGYGEPPEIVFWNLRDSSSTPVLSNQKGVALVSGFSKNLLKVFLEDESAPLEVASEEEDPNKKEGTETQKIDPREVMMNALVGEHFEDIKVVD